MRLLLLLFALSTVAWLPPCAHAEGDSLNDIWMNYGGARLQYDALARPIQLNTNGAAWRDPAANHRLPNLYPAGNTATNASKQRSRSRSRARATTRATTAPRQCPPACCPFVQQNANAPRTGNALSQPQASAGTKSSTAVTSTPAPQPRASAPAAQSATSGAPANSAATPATTSSTQSTPKAAGTSALQTTPPAKQDSKPNDVLQDMTRTRGATGSIGGGTGGITPSPATVGTAGTRGAAAPAPLPIAVPAGALPTPK